MTKTKCNRRPSVADLFMQRAYWLAFRAAMVWWFVSRPRQNGALVVIWWNGRALLIRNSYHSLWSLPGGSIRPGESPAEAACREAGEEIGVAVPVAKVVPALDVEHRFRFRRDRVRIFAWRCAAEPEILIDRREVVEARWVEPAEARQLRLIPHLADYFANLPGAAAPS
ncbi:MAG: hydrolase [Enterovirga sp.]|jgi:8-oxo-dGTP diphosphatase|nr:hydrolase [Enterovirga sp.]